MYSQRLLLAQAAFLMLSNTATNAGFTSFIKFEIDKTKIRDFFLKKKEVKIMFIKRKIEAAFSKSFTLLKFVKKIFVGINQCSLTSPRKSIESNSQ